MLDFWLSLENSTRVALITASATCLSALIGFTAVFIQIGRQGRNAIKANRQNEALKRKVEIYERTLETSRKAQDASSVLSNYLHNFDMSVQFAKAAQDQNYSWQPPAARFQEYQRLSNEASLAFIGVMTMIEAWHIIEPKLDIFRYAIAMGLEELRAVTAMRQPDALMFAMPVPGLESNWVLPNAESTAAIKTRIKQESYQVERLSAWVADFQVEMQMLLLSELFPNEVERRDPPDPDQFCIRLDRYEEINKRIDASNWGKRRVEIEAEAWGRFSDKNSTP
ncbi:hypothetical protein HGP14_02710 [Rhizobium sp. P32RR-XVIII]|uniref:hypothetical protein n=1 Tax=Rhizobium sp. P32RR-XVIII TaxID=2726738 RepID=UPI001456B0B1|nr:hypothetical protein [Rhizobium sp. P32RR-XVIII]NLS02280.1 hypothetical protein [Rhizobium sp. P32RR-XVIII]